MRALWVEKIVRQSILSPNGAPHDRRCRDFLGLLRLLTLLAAPTSQTCISFLAPLPMSMKGTLALK